MGGLQARRRGARKSIEGLRRAARLEEETFRDEEEDAQVRAQVPDGTANVARPTGFGQTSFCHSSFICRPRQQRFILYTSEKIDISETRLLRTSKERVAGDAGVAK